MSNQIIKVLKQAVVTFRAKQHKPEAFTTNLQKLLSLMDKITAEHVNLPSMFMNPELWSHPEKAPVSCIGIFEDDLLTMGIFILKPNGILPLHDHPQMHGLIKVIAGQVKIVSYSLNTERTKEIDQKSMPDGQTPMSYRPKPGRPSIVTAELNEVTIANVNSPTCVLEPESRNLHEIQSLDGPAAFLDILSPPYDYPVSGLEDRKCSYYTRLSQVTSSIFRLQEIKSPSWYWTDSYPYMGPDLDEVDVNS